MIDVLEGSRQAAFKTADVVPDAENDTSIRLEEITSSLLNATTKEAQKLQLMLSKTSSKCDCGISPDVPTESSSRRLFSLLALKNVVNKTFPESNLTDSYIAHLAALETLPLSARRLKAAQPLDTEAIRSSSFLHGLYIELCNLLDNDKINQIAGECTNYDIADLLDGRLLNTMFIENGGEAISGPLFRKRFNFLAWASCKTTGKHPAEPSSTAHANPHIVETSWVEDTSHSVLHFSNPVFDKHLLPVRIETVPEETKRVQSGRIFQEITHWHNAKVST